LERKDAEGGNANGIGDDDLGVCSIRKVQIK
jgi:hypothetical protein